MIYGGESPYHALTEKYNGTSWTEVADLSTARQNGGSVGTTSAAGAISGLATPGYIVNFEQFNGSSWSEAGDNNTGRQQGNGAGTNTAGLFFSGYQDSSSPNFPAITESWNGTSWTEVSDLNTGRTTSGGGGTQTSAISCGGSTGPNTADTANTELWDGTSWTEVNNLNDARYAISQGAGTQSQFLVYGGITPPYTGNTELFNGTSWTEVNNLSAARGYQSQTGQAISALSSTGNGPTTATEEFDADATLSTVSDRDWETALYFLYKEV